MIIICQNTSYWLIWSKFEVKSWKIPEYQNIRVSSQFIRFLGYSKIDFVIHILMKCVQKWSFHKKMLIICQNTQLWFIWSKVEVKSWKIAEYRQNRFLEYWKIYFVIFQWNMFKSEVYTTNIIICLNTYFLLIWRKCPPHISSVLPKAMCANFGSTKSTKMCSGGPKEHAIGKFNIVTLKWL